ncbi:hypothetical protein BAZSYMA_ACONTIG124533_0 [Bathymodiolus azoricus thioautotrophic gill symbiont]|uniref:Uncharacterized protein n=4 Tax=sulfur-oxidizing symbionts TaxID=32036 RepID=A0A1H6JVZ8_9GAMM|nr:hypothetical protein BAZSYMA_ACONTIG124533_0 [Bathymodiolus azoricus thioautotrophic gill symbiont]
MNLDLIIASKICIDLCINMNNHQKSTFYPLGNFLNPALTLLGLGLRKSPIGQKLTMLTTPIYAKFSYKILLDNFRKEPLN